MRRLHKFISSCFSGTEPSSPSGSGSNRALSRVTSMDVPLPITVSNRPRSYSPNAGKHQSQLLQTALHTHPNSVITGTATTEISLQNVVPPNDLQVEPANESATKKPLIAKAGFEIEIPSVRVLPSMPRGTLLLEGNGWRLETDNLPTMDADLEFVLAPMSAPAEIEKAMKEITTLMNRLRTAAIASPNQEVALTKIAPGGPACTLTVSDLRMPARLQATYGVGLKKISSSIDKLFLPGQAKKIHDATAKVAASYEKDFGKPLLDNARGFLELLNMYLQRAVGGSDSGTAHIYFRMMARSDFCSMFEKLLDKDSQEQIRNLLLAPVPSTVPCFMKALSIDSDATVFKEPYKDYNLAKDLKGPTVKDWFKSIIDGRGEGPLKKDLMSPPPGYPLHTGNFDVDYGMGAMNVDEKNKLILFEIRGAVHRPESIPMNRQIVHAVLREYSDAQETNPELAKLDQPFSKIAPHFESIARCEEGLNELKRIHQKLTELRDDAQSWKSVRSRIVMCQGTLRKIGAMPADEAMPNLRAAQNEAREFSMMLDKISKYPVPLKNSADIALDLPAFARRMANLERFLWVSGS